MEYYGIVDSHLLGLYSMMAKEVASLDINDFIQERSPYVPLQRGDSQSHLTVTLSSESTSDMGSETGDSDNDSESSGNPSPQKFGCGS
jgi:hypothetical protein